MYRPDSRLCVADQQLIWESSDKVVRRCVAFRRRVSSSNLPVSWIFVVLGQEPASALPTAAFLPSLGPYIIPKKKWYSIDLDVSWHQTRLESELWLKFGDGNEHMKLKIQHIHYLRWLIPHSEWNMTSLVLLMKYKQILTKKNHFYGAQQISWVKRDRLDRITLMNDRQLFIIWTYWT